MIAKSDLSLCWTHLHFAGLVIPRLYSLVFIYHSKLHTVNARSHTLFSVVLLVPFWYDEVYIVPVDILSDITRH